MNASISASEYGARRRTFLKSLGRGAAILPAPPVREGRYRADRDFFYLTGFAEPEAVAVFAPGQAKEKFVLFVRPRDPAREQWDGPRAGVKGAVSRFGADAAYPIAEFEKRVRTIVEGADAVHFPFGHHPTYDRLVPEWLGGWARARGLGMKGPGSVVDPRPFLWDRRVIKSTAELAALRRSAAIAGEAHVAALKAVRPGMREHELEAVIDGVFRSRGAERPAYTTIVGTGPNATILHYSDNASRIRAGDLVLVDAGAELNHYCSDISRTFPASGRFTDPQKALYNLVLKSEEAAIRMVRPGVRFHDVHDRVVRILTEGLVRLGFFRGPASRRIKDKSFRRYYMHGTGHWLGLDTHDVGRYRIDGKSRRLEPGMVLTIEPGLYVGAKDKKAPRAFRGMGIRIEDDVLVTRRGREVLTATTPKTIADIEAVMAR